MYDLSKKKWRSDYTSDIEPGKEDEPYSRFMRGSDLLVNINIKQNIIDGVAFVESAAKEGCAEAMYAMGDMFRYGWAVHKNGPRALEWYKRAAEAGYGPAVEMISELKAKLRKKRRLAIIISCVSVVTAAVGAFFIWYAVMQVKNAVWIHVNGNTELSQPKDYNGLAEDLYTLREKYDDEDVKSGEKCTNRVLVRYDGVSLDLSKYPAVSVVYYDRDLIVIQFENEEDARACIEDLSKKKGVVYAEMSKYTDLQLNTISEEASHVPVVTDEYPTSEYMSWGVAEMGLDQLSKYVAETTDNEVTVAVVDGGVLAEGEITERLIATFNAYTGGEKVYPHDHGTHVTGTVFDGTRGTKTYIIAVDIANDPTGESLYFCDTETIVLGIRFAIENGADVINCSFGSGVKEEPLVDVIEEAISRGIVVCVTAGNGDVNGNPIPAETHWPGAIEDCITVGAYDINHDIAYFCNYGPGVDVSGPGVNIFSHSHKAAGTFCVMNGTSMAAPHISALAALILHLHPEYTPEQVCIAIKFCCRTFPNEAAFTSGNYGAGAPDATAFIENYAEWARQHGYAD